VINSRPNGTTVEDSHHELGGGAQLTHGVVTGEGRDGAAESAQQPGTQLRIVTSKQRGVPLPDCRFAPICSP
jgi:hypothetical protein